MSTKASSADTHDAVLLCRVGNAAKGVVYALVGVLALRAAMVNKFDAEGMHHALRVLAAQPLGTLLLWLVVAGLFAFAAWRFVQALTDADRLGTSAQGLAMRAGYLISGLIHVSLAVGGATLAAGSVQASSAATTKQDLLSQVMSYDPGRWLVALAGLGTIVVGILQGARAVTGSFMSYMGARDLSHKERKLALWAGRVGIIARGVTFVLIGGLLIRAAWAFDASSPVGLSGAFDAVASAPFGRALLGAVATGFVLYGLHCFVMVRCRVVPKR